MGTRVLIDTNILIDYLAGFPQAHQELSRPGDKAISVISWIEVLAGLPEADHPLVEQFLQRFQLLALTPPITRKTVAVRKSNRVKLPDAVILATAQVEGRVLVTRNTRDFKPGSNVRVPYRL